MRNLPPAFLLATAFCCASSADSTETPQSLSGTNAPPTTVAQPEAEQEHRDAIVITNLTDKSELEYSIEEGISFYRYGVKVTYGDTELIADQAAVRHETGDVVADGNVRIRSANRSFAGDHVEYNFKTGELKTGTFRAGISPYFAHGIQLDGNIDNQDFRASRSYFTTDDTKSPFFKIQAKEFKVIAGHTMIAKGATIYVGDVPVMYLPAYKRDLTQHRTFWRNVPGYRSEFGPFLLNSFNFPITTNISAAVNLDLYQRRGFGVGPDVRWEHRKYGKGELRYYYIDDNDPDEDPFTKAPIDDTRRRISFSHQVNLRTNLNAKVVVRQQSDPWIVRDFFESEYRENTQPRSFLELNQLWSNWSLDFMAQPQVNNFYQTIERLPDARLSGLRQQIGESPLYYESESSLAYLRFRGDLTTPLDYAAMRLDSFHQVLLPQTYFGWLNFVPRVGGRFTQYGETDLDGPGTEFDDRSRFIFNTGAETSFKASRVWKGAESKFWDIHGVRHIIEPSINYVFVPEPNYRPNELPQFDTELPSLRLLPVDFPDYNAIDSIDTQNVFRLGLRNRVQTKRDDGMQDFFNWAIFSDWRLDPKPGQSTFSDIYSDFVFRPRSWLALNSETRYDIEENRWNAAYHWLTIAPNDTWSTRLGHRYFRGDDALFGPDSDNNTIFSSFYFKFNENWAARISHHFEARDGTMEEQYYTIYRDFRSWTGALTFRLRDNRDRSDDFAVAFIFQLKTFPRFKLGTDRDEPSLLLGS